MSDASTAWPLREPVRVLPTLPTSCTCPFMGFLASVASACSVSGGHGRSSHCSPPLALPSSKTGTRMWSESHPTSLAATVFLLLYSILKATSQYCTGSVGSLGLWHRWVAVRQRLGKRVGSLGCGRSTWAGRHCAPPRRVSPGGRAFT